MELDGLLQTGKLAIELIGGGTNVAQKLRELVKRADQTGIPPAQVNELALDLQQKLLDAQKAQLDLLTALGDLKSQMIETDRRLELQNQYEPYTTAAGSFVLRLKAEDDRGEPIHYICPDCADEGRKSFLQPQGTGKRCVRHDCFFPFGETSQGAQTMRINRPDLY